MSRRLDRTLLGGYSNESFTLPMEVLRSRSESPSHVRLLRMSEVQEIAMPLGYKIDRQATKEAKFTDWRSCHTTDGRLILKGLDMSAMRDEVIRRDRGQCQLCGAFCQFDGEVHHKIPRGRRRDDSAANLILVCQKCHRLEHVRILSPKKEKLNG